MAVLLALAPVRLAVLALAAVGLAVLALAVLDLAAVVAAGFGVGVGGSFGGGLPEPWPGWLAIHRFFNRFVYAIKSEKY